MNKQNLLISLFLVYVSFQKHTSKLPEPDLKSAVWYDYPAYALTQGPAGKTPDIVVIDKRTKLGGHKKKGPIKIPGADPVFDIIVNPEYIPEPFPAPYPFPIEVDDDKDKASNNPDDKNENITIAEHRISRVKPNYKSMTYIEKAEPIWECPKHYIFEEVNCVKQDSIIAQYGCPEGWKFNDNQCVAVETLPYEHECPIDYFVEDMQDNICQKSIEAPKQMICPENYIQTLDGCKQNVESEPVAYCDESIIENNKCVQKLIVKPNVYCPDSFVVGADYVNCYRQSVINGEISCPLGYVLDEHKLNCIETIIAPPLPECPIGFIYKDNTCIREVTMPPRKVCPSGTLTPDGHCNSLQSFGKVQIFCTSPATLDINTNMCYSKTTAKKSKHGCAQDGQMIDHMCIYESFTEPLKKCPSNSEMQGDECIGNTVINPILECPIGTNLVANSCTSIEATATKLVCAIGFELTIDNQCVQTRLMKPKILCQPMFTMTEDGLCKKIEKVPAKLECQVGGILQHDLNNIYSCHMTKIFDPKFKCGLPFTTLVYTERGPKCIGEKIVEPIYECPLNYMSENNKCIKKLTAEFVKTCPKNYELLFDKCVKHIKSPALVLCPESYELSNNQKTCVKRILTDPIPVCPIDMEFDSLVKQCYKLNTQYDFDEFEGKPRQTEPEEALKDLNVNPSTTLPANSVDSELRNLPIPSAAYDLPPVATPKIPPPQVTIVQQPVVIPQPAVILPQQAPVPPPPSIRVPYAVPQPVPTQVKHHAEKPTPPPPPPVANVIAHKQVLLNKHNVGSANHKKYFLKLI